MINTMYVTRRLVIKPVALSTHPIIHQLKWLNDPAVVQFSEQRHRVHTIGSQLFYIGSFKNPDRFLEISRQTIDEMPPIGTMTVRVDEPNGVANVGIMIGEKSEWGKGYGYEAWSTVCDDLLANGIRKIEAGCMAENKPMIKIFQKYEMFEDGVVIDHFLFNGLYVDMLLYGKINETV